MAVSVNDLRTDDIGGIDLSTDEGSLLPPADLRPHSLAHRSTSRYQLYRFHSTVAAVAVAGSAFGLASAPVAGLVGSQWGVWPEFELFEAARLAAGVVVEGHNGDNCCIVLVGSENTRGIGTLMQQYVVVGGLDQLVFLFNERQCEDATVG